MFLDWLAFTFKHPKAENALDNWKWFLFEFPELKEVIENSNQIQRSGHGYDVGYIYDDAFTIKYASDVLAQGVHVSVPAHGLQFFLSNFVKPGQDLSGFEFIKSFMQLLTSRYCKCSRIDLSYDDPEFTYLPWDFAKAALVDNSVVSKCQQYEFIRSAGSRGTFYFGTRKSGKLLRIYDKEHESKGVNCAIRYEFEFRKRYAFAVQELFCNSQPFSFADLLGDYIKLTDVKDAHGMANSDRIPACEKWVSFLHKLKFNEENSPKILIQKSAPSVDRVLAWVNTYVAPDLNVLLDTYFKDNPEAFMAFLRSCKDEGRFRPRHCKMVNVFYSDVSKMDWVS